MIGHICTDINQGALPALLPFLVLHKNISYASAAGLIFAANSVSSVVQPLFGYMGDKVSWPWLMGLGAFLAGGGLSLVGFLDSYWAIFLAVSVSGFGTALFHPEGGRVANLVAGENKGAGMALFSVGGNIGFALGPVIASVALARFGLKGTAVFLLPALTMAVIVLLSMKSLNQISHASRHWKEAAALSAERDDWRSFWKVSACLTARSVVSYGMTTFIPLYFAVIFLLPEASASSALTLYSVAGATATLFGGPLADRIGFRRIITSAYTLLFPLLLLFPLVGHLWLAVFLLVPIAISANAPQAAAIALGQKFLPNHIGTSCGIMLGLAVSIGGMVAPGLGWLGDRYGLTASMYAVAAFGLLTLWFAYLIPGRARERVGSGRESVMGQTGDAGQSQPSK